jgi:ribosomal protein S18 acetylase RimI-like enzyme
MPGLLDGRISPGMKSMSQVHANNVNPLITLRLVEPQDEPFLLEVYASTRMDELAATGWDEAQKQAFIALQFAAQQQHYKGSFPEGEHRIILVGNLRAGRIYVASSDREIRILDLTILPQYRDSGIGTSILQDILTEAKALNRPVRIYVESFNRSLRLFQRLGFRKADEAGLHFLMEWVPVV